MVNLELYRVFYTVAKCGSLTKAAEELYISQPAVSQAIKQLETQLGGKLFNRVPRGMILTEEGGKQMYEVVSHAIEMLDSAELKFKDMKSIASGSIRISASDYVTTFFLMKYIIEFREKYPNVSLSFVNSTSKECVEQIKAGTSDIGFVNLPINYSGVNFTGQTGIIHDVFVASPKLNGLFDKKIPLKELSNYPILLMDGKTVTRKSLDNFTKGLNINLSPDFELASVELLVEMAVNGLGVACVPKEYVLKELKDGKLKMINTEPILPTRAIGVITNKEKAPAFVVAEFLKLLNQFEDND